MMTICTFNARTLASEASIEDLMVQARKIRYDVIGLTETRRHRPLNATFDTGEELFLGTCDSRGVGGVGVLVNTNLAMNIDSFEQLTTRIGRLRLRRCGSMPALTVFVAYAPTSSYDEDEIEAFYMDLEKFYREDHTFYKVIVGDFNAKIGPRRTPEELHIGTHGLQLKEQGAVRVYHDDEDHPWYCLTDVGVVPKFYTGSDHRLLRARFFFSRKGEKAAKYKKRSPKPTINWDLFTTLAGFWEDTVVDNIDEEYERLIQHLRDSAKKAEGLRTTKRRLSHETLELIRQRGAARAAGNYQLTSELARRCREAIKEDLKERRAAVLAEAAEAGRSIRNTRRDFANRKTKMTALRRPDGTITSSRRVMEKVIYDFYSDLFDSHVHLPPCHLREDEYVIPSVLPSEVRHAIKSVKNRTAPGPDRIRPEHLKNLPTALVNTLARLFTRYLSECKVPSQWKTSRTVLLYKKGDPQDIGNYRPICLLSVVYKLFTRVILNRIERTLDEGQPCEQAGFRKGFSTIDHIHTVTRLIEVSREYKMPLCLTFIDLKKAFDTVETEAVLEALGKQGVPTRYIRIFRELYSNFTTRISPFYDDITIDVRRGVRQGDTVSPKLFTATLEDVMRRLEWDNMGVRVDGRLLHHLRFADDIVLITPSISQAERMLADFDDACGKIGLQLNLTKTIFMRNGWVPDVPFSLNGTTISECSSYVYLGREVNMMNDLAPELGRRKRAAWGAYKSIEDVVKKTKNIRLRAHLFNTTVLPALTYASETWALRKQDENAVSVIERSIERVMLGMTRLTQVRAGIRSSTLRQQSKIRDAAVYAKSNRKKKCTHKKSHLICAQTEPSARKINSQRSERTDDATDASSFKLEKSDKVQKSQLSTNLDSTIVDKNPLTKKEVQDALVKKIHDAETAEENQTDAARSVRSKAEAPAEDENKKQTEDEEATKSVVTAASLRVAATPPSICSKRSRRDEPEEVQKSRVECEEERACSRRSSRRVEKKKSKIEKSGSKHSRRSEVQQLSQDNQRKPQIRSKISKPRPIKIKDWTRNIFWVLSAQSSGHPVASIAISEFTKFLWYPKPELVQSAPTIATSRSVFGPVSKLVEGISRDGMSFFLVVRQ
ncbi:hypothetical protein Y032_0312g2166 [Ancylostoma ceylanicum]|nr:hypothetical protein Y032_0312g2166 [Ancylostoma ceylanicum]